MSSPEGTRASQHKRQLNIRGRLEVLRSQHTRQSASTNFDTMVQKYKASSTAYIQEQHFEEHKTQAETSLLEALCT
jgi:hypothetical protein